MANRPAVIVFARAPVAGRTKTRLIPALGPGRAAELYRCFLLDILEALRGVAAEVIVAAAETEDVDLLSTSLTGANRPDSRLAEVILQSGPDLGARIMNALRWALGRGHPAAVVIGTDAPDLPAHLIEEAVELAGSSDLVLGPCSDGGYYLIGMRALFPSLLANIPWSSGTVLSETMSRAGQLGLSVALLPRWDDVDTPDDLTRLRARLTAQVMAGKPIVCCKTWDYLCDLPQDEDA